MFESILTYIIFIAPSIAAVIGSIGLIIFAINKIRVQTAASQAELAKHRETCDTFNANQTEQTRILRDMFCELMKKTAKLEEVVLRIKDKENKDGE